MHFVYFNINSGFFISVIQSKYITIYIYIYSSMSERQFELHYSRALAECCHSLQPMSNSCMPANDDSNRPLIHNLNENFRQNS